MEAIDEVAFYAQTLDADTVRGHYQAMVGPVGTFYRRGDANADGKTDITDAIFTLGHLFLGTQPPSCKKAADTNDDAKVDISDAVSLLSYLFLGAVAPEEPLKSCGIDPTPDELTCESFAGCQ